VSLCRFPCHNGSWQRSLASQAPSQLQTSDTHWLGDLDAHRQYIERVGHELGIKEVPSAFYIANQIVLCVVAFRLVQGTKSRGEEGWREAILWKARKPFSNFADGISTTPLAIH